MGVRGDFARLKQLEDRLRSMSGDPAFTRFVGERTGAAAMKLVADGFRNERDPYGRGWNPLRRRRGRILRDTGRMAAGWTYEVTQTGFRLRNPTSYARYHQYGWKVPPHSRLTSGEVWNSWRTGRFVKRGTRGSFVRSRYTHQTFAHGINGPQRMMVPMKSAGGLGTIWGAKLRKETALAVRDWMRR